VSGVSSTPEISLRQESTLSRPNKPNRTNTPNTPNTPRTIAEHFATITDPRVERTRQHLLIDILSISLCAVISGADGFSAIAEYGRAKQAWLSTFLELPSGIPSHDTFGRVLARLDPKAFQQCFLNWIAAIAEVTRGGLIALDGKTLRRSLDRASGKRAIHMVSAWASANRLVLGQVKVSEKSNEITAIPELLGMLDIAGCIVTTDAMGCQTKIAAQIIEQKADYVLGLKGNQGSLRTVVEEVFTEVAATEFEGVRHDFHETIERGHGREEQRRYWTLSAHEQMDDIEMWAGLTTMAMVESTRTIGKKRTVERRYFISSLGMDAKPLAEAIRGHWGIENSLHWILDIVFREDESRIRAGSAAENMAVLRHIALNLLKREKTATVGVNIKRGKAGWDNEYLLKVLQS
jgi:predicted transposase YbfD/YdcC